MTSSSGGPVRFRPVPETSGPFVAALDADGRRALMALGHQRSYSPGAVLFLEGEEGTAVLVIRSGRVKVTTTTFDGHEVVLGLRGPNELVGELSSLGERPLPRSATGVAMTPVVANAIPNGQFVRFLENHPRALLALTRAVVDRLHDADRRRLEFGAYDTLGRLARLLHELAQASGPVVGPVAIDPPLTQHELAGLLGASRESVVRALGELRRRGIVETGRRRLVVVDPAALASISR